MPVSASFANAFTTLSRKIKALDQLDKFANANSPNYLAMKEASQEGADGNFTTEQGVQWDALEQQISDALSPSGVQRFLVPEVSDVALFVASNQVTFAGQLVDIRDYMETNSKTVETRTMGAVSLSAGGGNVGDGSMYVLTVDRHNNALQGSIPEA